MIEKKINEFLIEDLPSNLDIHTSIYSKPFTTIYALIAIAIILIITKVLMIVGMLLLVIGVAMLWKLPNDKYADICNDRIIIYLKNDKVSCQMVMYDEVKEWAYKQEKTMGDQLWFALIDGNFIKSPCCSSKKLVDALNKFIPQLESQTKKRAMGIGPRK